jgi:hypothetical protein
MRAGVLCTNASQPSDLEEWKTHNRCCIKIVEDSMKERVGLRNKNREKGGRMDRRKEGKRE